LPVQRRRAWLRELPLAGLDASLMVTAIGCYNTNTGYIGT
jgi:hypothetical protein